MEKRFSQKHCYLASILSALLCVFFTACGSAIAKVSGCNEYLSYIIISAAIMISVLIGIFIMKKSPFKFKEYGICKQEKDSASKVWFYSPLILIELIAIVIEGFAGNINLMLYVSLALFTIAVGFDEEIYFRGIVLKFIGAKGTKKAILVSSLIFGVCHLSNALGGQNIKYTLCQIVFAFLVGVVLSEIVVITKSLWGAIIFHMVHDFISYIVNGVADTKDIVIFCVMIAILAVYAIGLWKRLEDK